MTRRHTAAASAKPELGSSQRCVRFGCDFKKLSVQALGLEMFDLHKCQAQLNGTCETLASSGPKQFQLDVKGKAAMRGVVWAGSAGMGRERATG